MTPEARAEQITTQFVIDYEICLRPRPGHRAAKSHSDSLCRRIAEALRAVEQATEQRVWAEAATVTMNFPCVGGATDNVFMTMCNLSREFRRRAQGGTR